MLAILFRNFTFIAPKHFYILLSNISILSVPEEDSPETRRAH
jgi:hypothetical protein